MATNNHPHIELKSISCKGVKCFVLFQNPSLSVSVSVVKSDKSPKHHHPHDPQRTPVDKDNGENPEWDQTMRFELPPDVDNLVLLFEIKHHGGLLGTNIVGRVRVPMPELAAEQMPGIFHFVSYQVKSQDDKPNGVLTFSYKMKDAEPFRVSSDTIYPPNNTVSYVSPPEEYPQPWHNYPHNDAMNYLHPPDFHRPSLSNPVYPPVYPRPSEVNSLYPALDEVNSLYPPLPAIEPMYPPLPEAYRPSPGASFHDYPTAAAPWGHRGLGPAPAEGHGGYYAPRGNYFAAYPEPVDNVGCRMDGWSGRRMI